MPMLPPIQVTQARNSNPRVPETAQPRSASLPSSRCATGKATNDITRSAMSQARTSCTVYWRVGRSGRRRKEGVDETLRVKWGDVVEALAGADEQDGDSQFAANR